MSIKRDICTQIVAKCYKAYQEELRRSEAMDFDGWLWWLTATLWQKSRCLLIISSVIQYIHVDIKIPTMLSISWWNSYLASRAPLWEMRGWCDQSIYGWRGADMGTSPWFWRALKAKVVLLERTSPLRKFSNSQQKLSRTTITINLKKTLDSKMMTVTIVLLPCWRTWVKLFLLLQLLLTLFMKKVRTSKISVLYRTNAQSYHWKRSFTQVCIYIPWLGGTSSIARKEISWCHFLLKLDCQPTDNISFERGVNEPKRGVGPGTLEVGHCLPMNENIITLDASANIMLSPIKGKAAQGVYGANMILNLHDQLNGLSITEAGRGCFG